MKPDRSMISLGINIEQIGDDFKHTNNENHTVEDVSYIASD